MIHIRNEDYTVETLIFLLGKPVVTYNTICLVSSIHFKPEFKSSYPCVLYLIPVFMFFVVYYFKCSPERSSYISVGSVLESTLLVLPIKLQLTPLPENTIPAFQKI